MTFAQWPVQNINSFHVIPTDGTAATVSSTSTFTSAAADVSTSTIELTSTVASSSTVTSAAVDLSTSTVTSAAADVSTATFASNTSIISTATSKPDHKFRIPEVPSLRRHSTVNSNHGDCNSLKTETYVFGGGDGHGEVNGIGNGVESDEIVIDADLFRGGYVYADEHLFDKIDFNSFIG